MPAKKRKNYIKWMVIGLVVVLGFVIMKQMNGFAEGEGDSNLSNNANLSNLTLNSGDIAPPFSSEITNYTVTVPYKVTKVEVCPTLEDSTSTITVNGNPIISGSTTDIQLNGGTNEITIVVTANADTTKTYTITVTRKAASSNADLSDLNLKDNDGSTIKLSPDFSSNETSYTANVDYRINSINVTPIIAETESKIKVNGTSVSNESSSNISLNEGGNTIKVSVTAEDGKTTKIYTITVTRKAMSSNADLGDLDLKDKDGSTITLSPDFSSSETSYTANVDNDVDNVNITPTVADSKSTITVNGNHTNNDTSINVQVTKVGLNPITIVVTSENGSTKTYKIDINRAPSSNADLSSLTLENGSLNPAFTKDITSYAVTVGYNTSSLQLLPTANDGNATLLVKKGDSNIPLEQGQYPISLDVGVNRVLIEVTATDKKTKRVYEIDITRQYPPVDVPSISINAPTQSNEQAKVYITGNQLMIESTNPEKTGVHVIHNEQHGDVMIVRYGLTKASAVEGAKAKLPLRSTVQHVVTIFDDQSYHYFDNRYDVPINQQWNVAFNIPMDRSTLNKESMEVVDSNGNKVEMNFVIDKDGRNIKMIPKESYKSGEVYLLTINQNAKGNNGKPLKEPIRMIFIPK